MIIAAGFSIAIRIMAVIWSVILLRRLRDWRISFLTVMFALMAIRQSLTLWHTPTQKLTDITLAVSELPGLVVSIMAFLSIFSLGKILVDQKNTQRDFKESEERFHLLAENLDEIFWVTSIDGEQLLYVSPAYEPIFQRKASDLYQDPKSWITFILQEDQSRVIAAFTRENLVRGLFNVEYRIRRPDNSIRWIRAKGNPVKDEMGETTCIAGIAADITHQKLMELTLKNTQGELEKRVLERTADLVEANDNLHQEILERQHSALALQKSEERFRNLVTQSVDAFFVHDVKGRFLDVNPRACESLGYSREELLTMSISDIEKSVPPEEIEENLKTLIPGQTFRIEGNHRRKDGSSFPVEVYVGLIEFAGKHTILSVARDVTQRKQDEEQLQKARLEAEKASRAKSEFLSHMSHELRTPLNAILGFAQLLDLNKDGNLTPRQIEGVRQIRASGNHLLELINEVLDLTRIEAGSLKIFKENANLFQLVKRLLPVTEPLAREQNIEIHNHISEYPPLYVTADPTRLKQALINLLNNAIKYNISGGSVSIKTETIENQWVRIHVIDTGLGIPEEDLQKIFEPFERLDKEKTNIEGTGIGLTITQRLIHLMDGKLTVDSKLGKGSCFTIEMPPGNLPETRLFKPSSAFGFEEGKAKNPNGGQATILYIEDNSSNLKLVRSYLEEFTPYKIISSPDAFEGLKLARETQPSLILMDINLPEMDGLTAMKKLQQIKETRSIPVIAVSANAMKHDIQNALDAGFKGYLTKPLNLDSLADTISQTLKTSAG